MLLQRNYEAVVKISVTDVRGDYRGWLQVLALELVGHSRFGIVAGIARYRRSRLDGVASQAASSVPLKKLVLRGARTVTCRFLPVGSSTILWSSILIEFAEKVSSVEVPELERVEAAAGVCDGVGD